MCDDERILCEKNNLTCDTTKEGKDATEKTICHSNLTQPSRIT